MARFRTAPFKNIGVEAALCYGIARRISDAFGVGVVLETILAQQEELSRVRNDYLNIVTDYNKTQYALQRALGRLNSSGGTAVRYRER